jgi:branched-chain amino acid transport system ATP-binding protein
LSSTRCSRTEWRPLLEAREVTVRFGGLVAVDAVSASLCTPASWWASSAPTARARRRSSTPSRACRCPPAATLVLEGRSLAGPRPHRFAALGMARTFQTPRVFADMPVLTNIEFGLKFAGRGRASTGCGATSRACPGRCAMPGILTLIGLTAQAACPPSALTPSQQRLLEIGMALATRPRMLLLDEVAAGLTEARSRTMARLIRRLRDELDLTVVWIEHAVTTLLRHVERVIVLHQGRKIADGPPAEVVRNAEVMEAYLGDEMT